MLGAARSCLLRRHCSNTNRPHRKLKSSISFSNLSKQIFPSTRHTKYSSPTPSIVNSRTYCDKNNQDDKLIDKDLIRVLEEVEERENSSVTEAEEEIKQVLFSDEEKALMRNVNQKIPYTAETSPGVYSFENTVRPLVTFPDPTFTNLDSHEDVKEYTLGFPVVRPPAPVERWKEGLRIRKSGPKKYPWIQEYRSHYDILIIGGGAVGSCIANFLAERIKVADGFRIGVIEKDPTYRRCNTTQFLGNIRVQHGMPECIESALFATDFFRLANLKLTVPNDFEESLSYFNVPNVKLQPHGNLTLVTEENMENLEKAHKTQGLAGAQSAIINKKNLERRFPWLNTNGIAAGCLGLEAEGWFDSWNFLQSLILRNKYLGVDYIHGEAMFMKKHCFDRLDNPEGIHRLYEVHMFMNDTKQVYPIEFCWGVIACGAQAGNVGRMAGFGTGRGPMYMDIPVEPKRGYIFEVECRQGPGLNFPLVTDPSGLFVQRQGYANQYLVGILPSPLHQEEIPTNMFGDVDPSYFDEVVHPLLKYRIPGFEDLTVLGSRPVDYDYNYIDQQPIIGNHPIQSNIFMATGFNGRGAMYAPAAGRALMELMLDDKYKTIDFSRFSFDRFLTKVDLKDEIYG